MVSILVSRDAAAHFAPRIAQVLAGRPHRFVHLDAVPDADGDYGIDIGFLTRDVTGRSGKFSPSETMQRFFDMLAASRALKWVHTHSAGADRPVWKPIRERGITMTTSAGAMAVPVANSALGGILALARRFPDLVDAQRRHAWEPLLEEKAPPDLAGQTAMIVGLGPIGVELARLLHALGLRVVGVRRAAITHPACDETIDYGAIAAHLPSVDWLVLACPLTETTRGLFDANALAALPRGAHVVNVARGEVIVEQDLIAALRSGHLGGAWLDVFEHEPLNPASPLWDLPRVMVSPHSASHSTGNYGRVAEIFLDNLERFLEGRALRNEVKGR
jgi:D-2-hydroxyacid dehydrogenase (NADP+)